MSPPTSSADSSEDELTLLTDEEEDDDDDDDEEEGGGRGKKRKAKRKKKPPKKRAVKRVRRQVGAGPITLRLSANLLLGVARSAPPSSLVRRDLLTHLDPLSSSRVYDVQVQLAGVSLTRHSTSFEVCDAILTRPLLARLPGARAAQNDATSIYVGLRPSLTTDKTTIIDKKSSRKTAAAVGDDDDPDASVPPLAHFSVSPAREHPV